MIEDKKKFYLAIDLKSFFASVECVERGLDPLNTNLVVADNSRTEKTICLAVSPPLKSLGISSRPRLFEVVHQIKKLNIKRRYQCREFSGKSYFYDEILRDKTLEIDYIVALPRMAYYIKYSNIIYEIYLRYVAPEDIYAYSIDEVFIDITPYLPQYKMNPYYFAREILRVVLKETGITATAGIGSNLYLAKVAMDILSKRKKADKYGVRISYLDQIRYRKFLWNHKPLSDFWRIGKASEKKLHARGLYTMGDIARCSLGFNSNYYNEDLLYKIFGKNAELLIDHAWGYEPCTIRDIKAYKPQSKSIGTSQVLYKAYTAADARLVTWEMVDLLTLDLVAKSLLTNQVVLALSYDIENLKNPLIREKYDGELVHDSYGRKKPKHGRGTINIDEYTSSSKKILKAAMDLYDRVVNEDLLIRRISISFNKLVDARFFDKSQSKQLTIFMDYDDVEREEEYLRREESLQKTIIQLKRKFGKNAVIKGVNLEKHSTAMLRNNQIGGHKA